MSHGSWQPLRIDLQAIIKNFIEAYPYDPFEIMVIESIANSLDAKASRILLTLEERQDNLYYSISDNGGGMTKEEFEANYHALAISSKTKGEGIGFAGIGAKLYLVFLPSGKAIFTETRKKGSSLASYLSLVDGEPRWAYTTPSKLSQDGTYYELMINPDHRKDASEKTLIEIIQRHFNSILLDISNRKCEILVNGKKVESWKP
jgi:HSP90 family molecular chaperone